MSGLPINRDSRGRAIFVLPSGQGVLLQTDDNKVIAELKRRDFWQDVDFRIQLGQGFAVANETEEGLEIFLWYGQKEEGGFAWYAFPGAHEPTQDFQDYWVYLTNLIIGVTKPLKMEKPAR
jgi:hypothetical protein